MARALYESIAWAVPVIAARKVLCIVNWELYHYLKIWGKTKSRGTVVYNFCNELFIHFDVEYKQSTLFL